MLSEKQLRTGAWYGDWPLSLDFPADWDVTTLWPRTPPPLTDDQISEVLEQPVGQPPIRYICRGKSRPLLIIDDLNRPTPVARLMPFLLRHFKDGGIPAQAIRILVATGTHGAPRIDTLQKKVGPEAASSCQILVHDPTHNLVEIGRTSSGTRVVVNEEVIASDFVVGVGGIYPNHSAGFGGGSKLALGVLGYGSIRHLHYRHQSVGWGSLQSDNGFRKDLDEIARMIRLNTMISLQVDADREVVRVACGNHFLYYRDEVAFCRQTFSAPMPEDADVVISNAYPNDLSLTFVRKKGTTPLRYCDSGVSRIAIAACTEGVGHHGLFPFMNRPRFHRQRQIARRLSVMKPGEITRKIGLSLYRSLRAKLMGNGVSQVTRKEEEYPIWLYRPGSHSETLPPQIPGIRVSDSWSEIVKAVQREQAGKENLKVLLYPCAPLQCLDRSAPTVAGVLPQIDAQLSSRFG